MLLLWTVMKLYLFERSTWQLQWHFVSIFMIYSYNKKFRTIYLFFIILSLMCTFNVCCSDKKKKEQEEEELSEEDKILNEELELCVTRLGNIYWKIYFFSVLTELGNFVCWIRITWSRYPLMALLRWVSMLYHFNYSSRIR